MPSPKPQTWTLPVELTRHIGHLFLPEAADVNSSFDFRSPEYMANNRTLKALTYMCHATKDALEPLLFRFIGMVDNADLTHYFLLFAQNPGLRLLVRHITCLTTFEWVPNEALSDKMAWKIWKSRCDPDAGAEDVLVAAGYRLDYSLMTDTTPKMITRVDRSFFFDGFVKFMFSCVLMMLTETESLCFHRQLAHDNRQDIPGDHMFQVIRREGYSILPRLRVMELDADDADQMSDLMELFFSPAYTWRHLEKLVINNTNFDHEFFQILAEGYFRVPMPFRELYIRGPGASLDPEWEISVADQWSMMDIGYQPTHDAFRDLRLLDVEFPPQTSPARGPSNGLNSFISTMGGAPETLRLSRHPFPTVALNRASHTRLKFLVLNECTNMPEVMTDNHITTAIAALTYEGGFCLPNLEWVEVNGLRKGREELGV